MAKIDYLSEFKFGLKCKREKIQIIITNFCEEGEKFIIFILLVVIANYLRHVPNIFYMFICAFYVKKTHYHLLIVCIFLFVRDSPLGDANTASELF